MVWTKEFVAADGYNNVAINPPYSEERAKEHTLAALNHLNDERHDGGVLPTGYKPEELIGEGFLCTKSDREFTGITVYVFLVKRS